jgi:predicted metal-dependent TIM-barrel fold hydrolase
MHLDRSLRRLRLDPSTGIQEFLTKCSAPAPRQQINLVGVLVFCDPKTCPKDPENLNLPEGCVAAVRVHPKHAGDFGDYYFDRLSRLMDSPAVTALGEVGMDCSEGAKPFAIQKSTLRWVLALARPYMPLVLHVRASGEGPPGNGCFVPGGVGRDAGERSQHPAEYPPPLL